ncbi:MAG: dimethylsulfoxide reductase [Deltaproteobacteria bacterium HGW-Deltaproteobacteria-15]|jgi:anaerobic dimethyl sulfoxide reductase subunit B (iron-sulfur subunit)|nr:MAG: dimethylsulfoxide reductase [Deltaproteobacteria bacterium HGW-Deltaproteobacteria-15]
MLKGQFGFSFDASRCSGCMACVVACMDQNDMPEHGPSFRRVTCFERGEYPEVRLLFLSMACQHCGDAPCVMVCPTGALSKSSGNGIVQFDRDLCVGCHSCALACDFGVPQFQDDGKMNKCDFCQSRVEHGLEPACVRVCTTRALGFGTLEELDRRKAERASLKFLTPFSKGI